VPLWHHTKHLTFPLLRLSARAFIILTHLHKPAVAPGTAPLPLFVERAGRFLRWFWEVEAAAFFTVFFPPSRQFDSSIPGRFGVAQVLGQGILLCNVSLPISFQRCGVAGCFFFFSVPFRKTLRRSFFGDLPSSTRGLATVLDDMWANFPPLNRSTLLFSPLCGPENFF